MMHALKITFASAAALGLALASTANAAPARSASALPTAIVLKQKLTRTVAPAKRASKAVTGTDVGIGILAAGLAGFAGYELTKPDSPAG